MYTVNYTNFFEFGVDTGDAQYEVDLPGPVSLSPLVNLSIPIRFLGVLHGTLRVCMSDMYAFIYMSFTFMINCCIIGGCKLHKRN